MIRNVQGQVLRSTLRRRGRIRVGGRALAQMQPSEPHFTENRSMNSKYLPVTAPLLRSYASRVTVANSSADDELDYLERVTHWLVGKAKVGSMDTSSIHKALDAAKSWYEFQPRVGYALDSADRILDRLIAERSIGSYAARSQLGYDTLTRLYILACQSWLSLGLDAEIALNQAEDHLAQLGERYFTGDTDYPPLDLLEALVQARLQRGTNQSLRCASNLLVWWTDHDNTKKYEDMLASLFHKALVKSINAKDRTVARDLLDRMQWLSTEANWKQITPNDETISKALQIESLEPPPDVANQKIGSAHAKEDRRLSLFEVEALERNFQKVLQTASAKDLEKVKKLVAHLESQKSLSRDLSEALVRYFLKIKEAKEATEWLRKFESTADKEGGTFSVDIYRELLGLWFSSSDDTSETPWRAQEILDRMEQLEAKHGTQLLKTSDFNAVILCWSKTKSSVGQQKIASLFNRMERARQQGASAKSPDLDSCTLLLSSLSLDSVHTEVTLAAIFDAWSTIQGTGAEKEKLLRELLEAYARAGMGVQASRLIRLAKSEGLGISVSCGKSLLEAHATSGDLSVLANELHYLEQNLDTFPPVAYYKIALTALLQGKSARDTFEQEQSLLDRALVRCRNENDPSIDDISDMQEMMKTVLWKMKWQKRANDADKMLRHLESATLLNHECTNSGLFPSISCYNHVLEALVKAGSSKAARQTFHRLLKFYHDGHSTCLPNTPIFDMYLTLLAKSKSMKGVDLAEEARSVLEELLNIYEVTGSAECMPDERIFNLVLLTFTKGSSQKTVEASFALLDRMSMIGVMPNEFTINTIMSITLQAKVEDGFRKVISLIDLMEDLGLEPTTFTYRTILNACSVARDSEKEQALQQTISIMAQLTKLEDADAMLFASLAKAISTLLPRGNRRYEKLIKSTLRLAHQKGPLPPGAEKIFRSVLGKNNGKGMLNATNARRAAMQSRPRLSNA